MRVLVVDDHAVVRDGLRRLLADEPEPFVVGEAATAEECLVTVREQRWDVVVLDIALDGRSGLDLLKTLKSLHPELPVLILTMHREHQYALRAFRAGAGGYVTKSSSRTEIARAIRVVAAGGRFACPDVADKLLAGLDLSTQSPPHASLSDREFEVMRHLARGRTVGQVAELLSLSTKTITTHRARILKKMGLNTNAELTYYALEAGLLEQYPS